MPVQKAPALDGWGQHKKRTVLFLFDQHKAADYPNGRPWWCYGEVQVDPNVPPMPVGDLQPVVADVRTEDGEIIKGWSAPWVPEQKYVQMSIGMRTNGRFRIRYDAMIADYRAGTEEYYRRAMNEAAALNLPMPSHVGAPVAWKLKQIVGEPPKSPKVPEAALSGDRWLLGFSDDVNEELKRLLYTGQSAIPTPDETSQPEFTEDELAEAVKVLRGIKQAKTMRQAKATKQTSDAA